MSSIQLRQTLFKRGNTVETGSYVGPIGEAVIDTDQLTFRIQDGITPGGHLMASSGWLSNISSNLANLMVQYNTITSLDVGFTANINALIANIANQQNVIGNITSNVSRLQANIGTAYGNANVAAYLSNYTGTLVNSSSIQTLTSEVGALQSNTAGLQNQINTINSNVSAIVIPANVSVFTNDANYANTGYVNDQISTVTGNILSLEANIAASNITIQTLSNSVNSFETWANVTFSTNTYGNADVAGYLSLHPVVPQIVNVPEHNYGQDGDRAGTMAFDSDYIYYCTENFVDGVTAIWQRIAWTAGTW